jgi:predicted phosphodiesterase
MATLVIPDLHGKVEVAKWALDFSAKEGLNLVFLGDYLDSFDRSIPEQYDTLRLVLDAVNDDDVIALMGNHELSYLNPRMQASGFTPGLDAHLMSQKNEMRLKLWNDVFQDGFLLTHAGLSLAALQANKIDNIQAYLDSDHIYDIGWARGGSKDIGGIFWCDWNEEFEGIEGVNQMFGHTASTDIRREILADANSKNFCIDCLDYKVMLPIIENGSVLIWIDTLS